jgi:GT2 family glycosyltransferase
MFALEQAGLPYERRRRVWTVAGDGTGLEAIATGGTMDGLDGERESALDWEIVQYRFSERVLTMSDIVADWVSGTGGNALLTVQPEPRIESQIDVEPSIWLPEPVSRRSQFHRIIRSVGDVVAGHPDVTLVVSPLEEPDSVWTGSAWDVAAPANHVPSGRITRSDAVPPSGSIVVLGDKLAIPTETVAEARRAGALVVVPEGSAAAALWDDAPVWNDEDDLAHVIADALAGGRPTGRRGLRSDAPTKAPRSVAQSDRAASVSVGVPIYRNVAYLDECIESILAQTEPVHEILLLDDGSNSADVTQAVDGWVAREPSRIRSLRQPNRGVCVARNRLVAEMSGDAFLLVDHDDVLDPDFIRLTSQALRQDESLWAVAAWTEFFGDYEGVEAKPPFDRRVGLRENPIISTAALVDMNVRDRGIAFAPDLAFIFCEDWHYWSQIVAAGGNLGLVPRALVRHRVHQASGGFQRTEQAHRIGRARAVEPLLRSRQGELRSEI